MQSISESTRVVRNEDLPAGEIGGELVAMDLERGTVFGLDEIGALIWKLSAEPVSVGAIADVLVESHDVDRETCLADLTPFISELLDEGLLHRLPE